MVYINQILDDQSVVFVLLITPIEHSFFELSFSAQTQGSPIEVVRLVDVQAGHADPSNGRRSCGSPIAASSSATKVVRQ